MTPARLRLAPLLLASVVACGRPGAPVGSTVGSSSAASVAAPPGPASPASFVVRGRLLDHDGAPLKLAHVHLGARSFPVDATGAFRVAGSMAGFFLVRFTGVDHADRTLGLLLDGRELELEVRLGTYERIEPPPAEANLVIREGSEGASRRAERSVPLKRRPDGVYVAEVEAAEDTVLYQVQGIVQDRTVDGPEADGFVYDGGGDYLSRLHVREGKVIVRVDPARLPAPGQRPTVRFADPESHAARVSQLHFDMVERVETAARQPADTSWRAEIARRIDAECDAEVAAALRIVYLVPPPALDGSAGGGRPPAEAAGIARALLDTLDPGASLWSFRPQAALTAVDLAGRRPADEAYLDRILYGLRDQEAAAELLGVRLREASLAGREEELHRLYAFMRERFADTPAARAAVRLDPARDVRMGRPLPDFSLPALADGARAPAGAVVTPASLHGKIVLIDFWATWCPSCLEEMRALDQTFEKHHDEGFTIVSIAANEQVAAVRRFRAQRWSMPWQHVVLDEANEAATLARFEVSGFPTPIRVDAAGKFLAGGSDLRGEGREASVAAAIAARARAAPPDTGGR